MKCTGTLKHVQSIRKSALATRYLNRKLLRSGKASTKDFLPAATASLGLRRHASAVFLVLCLETAHRYPKAKGVWLAFKLAYRRVYRAWQQMRQHQQRVSCARAASAYA